MNREMRLTVRHILTRDILSIKEAVCLWNFKT